LKTEYFVRAATPVRVSYRDGERILGDRYDLEVTVASEALDRDGFVMDFERLQRMVHGIRDRLESQPLDELLGGTFDPQQLLDLVRGMVQPALNTGLHVKRIKLDGEGEGFSCELD